MKILKFTFLSKLFVLFIVLGFISCSKDDNNSSQSDSSITVADFSKTLDENPQKGASIGTISASTNNGTLAFELVEDSPNGALYLNAATGALTVANETLFDFETNPKITGTVKVINGDISKTASIIITLNDLEEENVYVGSIELKTQQEVNDFGRNNYTRIEGSLTIGSLEEYEYSDITDLSPLQSIEKTDYSLIIVRNPNLISTVGLNISEIGSQLAIVENSSLESLKGFKSVTLLPIGLFLAQNSALIDCSDLNSITEMGDLFIGGCPMLENIDWLTNLKSINSGGIHINSCNSIKNIDGLSNITNLTGEYVYVEISNNTALENLSGLHNLSASVRYLTIDGNSSLLSLQGIENIVPFQNLNISRNNSLQNLNGLEKITELYDSLTIVRNNSLTDLHGLDNLNSVNSFATINNNEKLASLNGLENLSEVFILESGNNPQLSNFCALQNLVSEDPNISLNIHHNAYNPTKQDIIDGNCSL